jgi:predicted enzyme related to lactoylglutathione lyase
MPERSSMTGAPCWADLFSSDPAASERFYGELFGWTAQHGDEEKYGGYITFSLGGKEVAGAMRNDGSSGMPDLWSVYLSSGDANSTVRMASDRGGSVIMEPMEVPDTGVMAMLADPGGAGVGVWEAKPFDGFAVVGEPGSPDWVELHTRSYDEAVAFYRDVFGWDTQVMSDSPEMRYATLGKDDASVAGIFDASGEPAEAFMGWVVYWGTDDCDATAAKAKSLGGTVVRPPDTTPYGRMATLADTTGAMFRVITPPAR